jgi:predicted dehydrogenase
MSRRIRYGMVGGTVEAFIGAVHRMAANLDGSFELVCGAFSSSHQNTLATGAALGLNPARCYPDFQTMMTAEAALPAGQRMECVVIVTPNHLHFEPAIQALQHGFHVMADKPATFTLAECRQLAAAVKASGKLYGLTHTYTGYPMIQEARERVQRGELGNIRRIIVQYTQGWLSDPVELAGNAQAAWRVDPARAGVSCCMGDIGVHAFNLAETVTGLQVTELSAELNTFVQGRALDDDGTVLMHYSNGARGTLIASQICIGDENHLSLRIFGDKGGLEWQQMEPNTLWLKSRDAPTRMLRTGTPATGQMSQAHMRVPPGHPEGYIEAFANLYSNFATNIRHAEIGNPKRMPVPGITDALRGMAFIEATVQSSANGNCWLPFPQLD